AKIATISDLHLGEKGFGLVVRRPERPTPHERHPLRCSRAAVREAVAWGAELLVVKGDLTHAGRPEEWLELDRLLADIPIPVILMPGNHDAAPGSVDFRAELERRGHPHQPVR